MVIKVVEATKVGEEDTVAIKAEVDIAEVEDTDKVGAEEAIAVEEEEDTVVADTKCTLR